MATIKDIAKRAGVSITTVSRVLNEHPYVAEEKRLAVKKAIQQLNYAPNHNAIHLVKGKTGMIGVILPYVNNPYFSTTLEGISEEALAHGYRLILCQTDYDTSKEMDALQLLKNHQVDGIIICSRTSVWSEIEPFTQFGPITACEYVESDLISSVYVDYYQSFKQGMSYLVQNGHRRIGYCIGRKESTNSRIRQQAYRDVLRTIGEEVRADWIWDQCLDIESGVNLVRDLVRMKERPSALLVASDQTAAGIIAEARSQGLDIPHELSLISFDNHPIAGILNLTTIEHPSYQVGQTSFQVLHQLVTKNDVGSEKKKIPYRFIERGSVSFCQTNEDSFLSRKRRGSPC